MVFRPDGPVGRSSVSDIDRGDQAVRPGSHRRNLGAGLVARDDDIGIARGASSPDGQNTVPVVAFGSYPALVHGLRPRRRPGAVIPYVSHEAERPLAFRGHQSAGFVLNLGIAALRVGDETDGTVIERILGTRRGKVRRNGSPVHGPRGTDVRDSVNRIPAAAIGVHRAADIVHCSRISILRLGSDPTGVQDPCVDGGDDMAAACDD